MHGGVEAVGCLDSQLPNRQLQVAAIAMSAYRKAIDSTVDVITLRSHNFRNQVIAVVIVASGSLIACFVLGMLWPLAGWMALAPVCGLFLWLDARGLAEWRSSLLANWALSEIDLTAFGHAMRAHPALPKATLEAMLDSVGASPAAPARILSSASPSTRRAIAATTAYSDAAALRDIVAKVCISAIVVMGAAWSAALHRWQPLALASVGVLWPLSSHVRRMSSRRSARLVVRTTDQDDFDPEAFRIMIDVLVPGIGLSRATTEEDLPSQAKNKPGG